jgi:nitrate reductase gamma subunit
MEAWLDFARGPAFVFAFSFMILGLIRHLVLTVWEIVRVMRRAGDKTWPYRQVCVATLKWLFPADKLKNEVLFSLTSIVFHIAILIVPIFLGGHIVLWARGLGVSWTSVSWLAIPNALADVLTIVAVVTAVALVIQRVSASATRTLSRFQDYALPLVIAVPFASGFFVMHSAINPFSFQATLFVHVMSANLVFILIPITKLSHAALIPGTQLVSEVAWHWPSDAGSKLAVTLGKEDEPI